MLNFDEINFSNNLQLSKKGCISYFLEVVDTKKIGYKHRRVSYLVDFNTNISKIVNTLTNSNYIAKNK